MIKPEVPNLELVLYKAVEIFGKSKEIQSIIRENRKNGKSLHIDFEVIVFPQVWGSTNTGFDVTPSGGPTLGGCVMTKEYTTVVHETGTDTYFVFFGEDFCYFVSEANQCFLDDLEKRQTMASLSVAKTRYLAK